MQARRAGATLSEDGVIALQNLPFLRGESVEIIVRPIAAVVDPERRCPLRGTPITLLAPTEPVAETDWENAR